MEKTGLGPERVLLATAASFFPPMSLWLALNFLRPDLIQPMLDHVYGYMITLVELLLMIGGAIVYVIASQQLSGPRVTLAIGGLLLCTLPTLALVLFGPIVFAFMYGAVS